MTDFRRRQARIWNAEDDLLVVLDSAPLAVDALLAALRARGFDDYSGRAALWALVGRGDVTLRQEHGDVFVVRPA